jgi:hypothetical protein
MSYMHYDMDGNYLNFEGMSIPIFLFFFDSDFHSSTDLKNGVPIYSTLLYKNLYIM